MTEKWDVVVVGAGNAALSAALMAHETGAKTLVLERASREESGGNSRYSTGTFRFTYDGVDDIVELVPDLTEDELARTDFGSYSAERYFADMFRTTRYRADPALTEQLVNQSHDAVRWLQKKGVRFMPAWDRHGIRRGARITFTGECVLDAWSGGEGLVAAEMAAIERAGIQIHYSSAVTDLIYDGASVVGVNVRSGAGVRTVSAGAVVLACGGFQANPEWRARYLGPGWEFAKVRGSRFNTGEGIRMALEVGAMPTGHWSWCHAVSYDNNAPETGNLVVGSAYQKQSYMYGILINARGRRFVDEGEDIRIKTYSKMGRVILAQPEQFAWQVFDSKTIPLLRDEYRIKGVSRVSADTLEELAGKLEGVDAAAFLDEVKAFNAAVDDSVPFDMAVKDGKGAKGLAVPKSNWAQRIDTGPFEAYQVGCGITFTYGGLRVVPETAQVLDRGLEPVAGLYTAGEMLGGLFYHGYPGGSGLMAGTVFGRIAGKAAAEAALRR